MSWCPSCAGTQPWESSARHSPSLGLRSEERPFHSSSIFWSSSGFQLWSQALGQKVPVFQGICQLKWLPTMDYFLKIVNVLRLHMEKIDSEFNTALDWRAQCIYKQNTHTYKCNPMVYFFFIINYVMIVLDFRKFPEPVFLELWNRLFSKYNHTSGSGSGNFRKKVILYLKSSSLSLQQTQPGF